MPPKRSNTLTEAELRIMKILWRRGESAVTDLVSAMPDHEPLAYNSVLTTIRILERKGYVEHVKEGRAYVFRPLVGRKDATRSEILHLIGRFFRGSHDELVLNILQDRGIDAEELQRLREMLDKGENQ